MFPSPRFNLRSWLPFCKLQFSTPSKPIYRFLADFIFSISITCNVTFPDAYQIIPLNWVSQNCPNLSTHSGPVREKPSHFDGNSLPTKSESNLMKWVSRISFNNPRNQSKISFLIGYRGFCTEKSIRTQHGYYKSLRLLEEARAALLNYLHGTRGLDFSVSEHMSKNSPVFLNKLLDKVEKEKEISHALWKFLLFHPINEFEPFFESMGLKPSEIGSLLPRDLMFLSDDQELLGNFRVLCNYGIACRKIGKMYKEATEIFRYKSGVLGLKIRAYEELGLSTSSVAKVVASAPFVLIGDVNKEFVQMLEELEGMGIERDWLGGLLFEKNSYDWSKMLMVMNFFTEIGFTKMEMGPLIRRHPHFLLDGSGKFVFSTAVLLLKMGGTRSEMVSLFSQFPNLQIGCFRTNLWQSLLLLIEIDMDTVDIQKLLRTHTEIFGSCSVKRANSLLTKLNVGKKRLCRIIKENPRQLEKYVFGVKISRLPTSDVAERRLEEKRKFLSQIGFADNSDEMKKALTDFRGRADQLQDRFDFLVKTGFDPEDLCYMLRTAPQILNQKIDLVESKIDFLVNNLGYPLSVLVAFPSYLSYSVERVKLRFSMYNWLKDRGAASPNLSLGTILASSDKEFIQKSCSLLL